MRVQSDLLTAQEQVHVSNLELRGHSTEEKHARQRTEDDRVRRAEEESRRSNIQAEAPRTHGRTPASAPENWAIWVRRGHAEAELASLVDKATSLAEAHEEALADIQEAERLRARLAEEPLAQALLDDNNTFQGLGPVLERLEHARGLGIRSPCSTEQLNVLSKSFRALLTMSQQPLVTLSSEVMTLLERQVPQTAGAVRGLARWSVQQRLEQQLGNRQPCGG